MFWDIFEARYGSGKMAVVLLMIPLGCGVFCGLHSITSASRYLFESSMALLDACLTTAVMTRMRPMVVARPVTCQTAHNRVCYSFAQHVALWVSGALQLICAIGESTCLSELSWQNRFTLRTGIHKSHCITTWPKGCDVCQCKSGPTCCALHLMSRKTLKIVVGQSCDPFCGVAGFSFVFACF